MKLSEFILLPEEGKKKEVLRRGSLIGKRNYGDHPVFLFQLDGFYVQVFCSPAGKAIREFRVFKSTGSLSPYLESIALDDLL
jgi:hypothetical protein